ncbi:MAG: 16S rRNA (adenine(1518)-N(6)/adenine(1519)-N(6))-dimethyltransferase RsmA [Cytophagaceae bacterium]
MKNVRAKKHLGQHFLRDEGIAGQIVESLTFHTNYGKVLEVGPGMGVLSKYLINKKVDLHVVELDRESVAYLKEKYTSLNERIIEGDFLKLDFNRYFSEPFGIIGNFPYNISSQIFFKVLEFKNQIPEVVGMVQKEVGSRIACKHGSKEYGILSVLLQAFYNIEYLFTVEEHVFDPPPKVKSAVIRLKRNDREKLPVNEVLFFKVVKQSFSTRRKTLRNALKPYNLPPELVSDKVFDLRAEQLSVEDFIDLTGRIQVELKKRSSNEL